MSLKTKTKTPREFSLDEKTKKLQAELNEAAQKEQAEVSAEVEKILKSKGYALSAQMILEPGKAPVLRPFIVKVGK